VSVRDPFHLPHQEVTGTPIVLCYSEPRRRSATIGHKTAAVVAGHLAGRCHTKQPQEKNYGDGMIQDHLRLYTSAVSSPLGMTQRPMTVLAAHYRLTTKKVAAHDHQGRNMDQRYQGHQRLLVSPHSLTGAFYPAQTQRIKPSNH
jgi:hypothetical protein